MTSPRTANAPAQATELAAMLRIAVASVEDAGRFLRERVDGLVEFHRKGTAGDVVSDLDVRAEQMIVRRLRAAYPEIPVLAEESGLIDAARIDARSRIWLVDPLDGTNNLAIGLPAYVTGVALCQAGEPLVSAVHEPRTGRTWQARRGGRLIGPDGQPVIRTLNPERRRPVVAWTQGYAVDSRDATLGAIKAILEREARRVLPLWAPLLGWTMLARGDIDGIIGYRPQLIDLPGGMLLAQESGLEIRTLRGEPFLPILDQNTVPDADLSFVSATPECMPMLLEWLGFAERLAPDLAKVFGSSRSRVRP